MKLRCTNNSIRLRLVKSDLKILQQEGTVRETIHLAPGLSFAFELTILQTGTTLQTTFDDHTLRIHLPQGQADAWIHSNQVSIDTSTPIDGHNTLHTLIEKDFPCKDRPDEDKNNTFWELAKEHPDTC